MMVACYEMNAVVTVWRTDLCDYQWSTFHGMRRLLPIDFTYFRCVIRLRDYLH